MIIMIIMIMIIMIIIIETWPCGGKEAAMNDCIYLLTHEQAMADYVQLLTEMKTNLGATESKVIVFGGSYGGTNNKKTVHHIP
jgi:hypothetical protein